MSITAKNRIWIEGKDGTFLGNGRIRLLELVDQTGSINEAAKILKMSYRKAWSMLDSMNSQVKHPYLIKKAGGTKGGGTEVTDAGRKAIQQFRELDSKCRAFLDREMKNLQF